MLTKFAKHKWLSLILIVAVLLVLAVIAFILIFKWQPGRNLPRVTVNELGFGVGRSRVFAYSKYDGAVACAGTLGFQVLGPDGRETLGDSYRATSPALEENNGYFIAFDVGGTSVRTFTADNMLSSFETEGKVVSASINKNAWFCVVTQEQFGRYLGTVSVYNDSGNMVYQVTIGSSFVYSAYLSDDNNNLTTLGIAQSGSVMMAYAGINEDKDSADYIIDLGADVFLELSYLTNTSLLAVSENAIYTIDLVDPASQDPMRLLYSYDTGKINGYTYTDNFIALHIYDHSIGYNGKLISLTYDGTILEQYNTTQEISSIDSCGDILVTLGSDGISFFSKTLELYPVSASATAAITSGHVLALGEDMALGANDLSAFIIMREVRETPEEERTA